MNTCTDVRTSAAAAEKISQPNGIIKTDANKNDVIENGTATNGIKHAKHTNDVVATTSAEPKTKRARIQEKITYDDLATDDTASKGPTQLNLAKVERYLHGPVPMTHTSEQYEKPMELETTQYHIIQERNTWSSRKPQKVLVSATAAVNALGELSPGGALMRGFQEQSLARKFLILF